MPRRVRTIQERRNSSRSIVGFKESGVSALFAIATGAWLHNHDKTSKDEHGVSWSMLRNANIRQRAEAFCFYRSIGLLDLLANPEPWTEYHYKLIQAKITEYGKDLQLVVIKKVTYVWQFNKVFIGQDYSERKIVLEVDNNQEPHTYCLVTNIAAYLGHKQFCWYCERGFHTFNKHNCPGVCDACRTMNCEPDYESPITCETCGLTLHGAQCFERHKKTRCNTMKFCNVCEVAYRKKDTHLCDWQYCERCRITYRHDHHHFLQPLDAERLVFQDKQTKVYVFFDIETYTRKDTAGMMPNLVIAHVACDECWILEERKRNNGCDFCVDKEEHVFWGENCVTKFCDLVYNDLSQKVDEKGMIHVYAQNFRGFDGKFVFRDLFDRLLVKPDVIMMGQKLMRLKIDNVIFKDAANYWLGLGLTSLSKTFGFDKEFGFKGFFPHKFNQPDKYNHVGAWPDLDDYGPEYMKEAERTSLVEWYELQKDKIFNFKEEIIEYCRQDVVILKIALHSLRTSHHAICGVDATTRAFTQASIGLEYFRAFCLKANSIGITPPSSYQLRNCSTLEVAWLDTHEQLSARPISRQRKLGSYYADGFDELGCVYEFWGCYYHGCTCVHSSENARVSGGATASEARAKVAEKLAYYGRRNFAVVQLWEHELPTWKQSLSEDLRNFFNRRVSEEKLLNKIGRLDARDAFFGGRTGPFATRCEVEEGEKIFYDDVVSLYPFVQSKFPYPLGHPIPRQNVDPSEVPDICGVIRCDVLPPKTLYLPVLPVHYAEIKKLVFPLCAACLKNQSVLSCYHTDEERMLRGTWTSVELNLAIQEGYVVTRVWEVLHYEEQSDEVFSEYIKTFLKTKIEASGWGDKTEDEKDAFVAKCLHDDGIVIDKEKVEKCPGKRALAKMLLNCLWGKLAQRPNLPKTVIVQDGAVLQDLLERHCDGEIDIKDQWSVNEKTSIVNYVLTGDGSEDPGNTSLVMAMFVTSYARCHLYKIMKLVDASDDGKHNLLYTDTDSVIYKCRGARPVQLSDQLGGLTDEIVGMTNDPGAYIDKALFLGPKFYCARIKLSDGSFVNKFAIKGISYHFKASEVLNEESLTQAVERYERDGVNEPLEVPQVVFESERGSHHMFYEQRVKRVQITGGKRFLPPPQYRAKTPTLPFGYVYDESYSQHVGEDNQRHIARGLPFTPPLDPETPGEYYKILCELRELGENIN